MADVETKYPPYVTDGNHIYLWHSEYERLFNEGKLKASEPPVIQANKPLSPRQRTKIEEARKKALVDAERAVMLLKSTGESNTAPTPAIPGQEIDLDE